MIYPHEFRAALETVQSQFSRFLMVGRRWDTDITALLDFSSSTWEGETLNLAREKGVKQPGYSVDYFSYRRGL
jgi:hypothetical protein